MIAVLLYVAAVLAVAFLVGVYLNDMAGNPVDGMFYLSVTC